MVIIGWEAGARAAQLETESCRIPHHVHRIEFRQIVRDAEIAYAISPVVRKHRLSAEETEKFLLELRIPRAANVRKRPNRATQSGLTRHLGHYQLTSLKRDIRFPETYRIGLLACTNSAEA